MKQIFTILLITGLLCHSMSYASDTIQDPYRRVPFQLTFLFPPLSTNWTNFGNTVNNFSLNLLVGISAGTDGVELGSLVNINRYFMQGVQFSGFMNLTGGSRKEYSSSGLQGAGFTNITNTNFKGVSFAGFTNIYPDSTSGLFISGLMNLTGVSDKSVQIAGFTNIAPEGNISVQAAGFLNVAREVKGLQVAGFVNIAKNVKGVQLAGFINICDTIDGIPIGFINIVKKNGYNRFEISTTDYAFGQVSFKLGTRYFYNIYSFSKLIKDKNRYSFGGGFGSEMDLGKSFLLNLELTVHQVLWINDSRVKDLLRVDRLNLLTQFKIAFGKELGNRVSVYLAPAINVSVSTDKSKRLGPDFQPYWKVTPLNGNDKTQVRIWPGFSAGFRF